MTVRKPLRKGRVRIDLFGAPRIERGGVSIAPDTRKALALVAYLAVTKRAQARDRLAALLWPEADAERARGALRRTLSSLRTALGGEHLVTDGHRVALDEDVDCDVTRFRALAAEGRLGEAAEAYAGDFLAGFSLRGEALEFEEWQLAEADALRRELSGVLERLAQQDADPERAIAAAKRWVAIDPLHEPAHRALMRLYARAGDRSAALRQYRECARQLDRELGVSPLPETVALRGAIEQGELEPAPRPPATGVHERVGDLYTLHGDYPEAIASYQAALAESTPAARPAIAHKLADVHHGSRRSAIIARRCATTTMSLDGRGSPPTGAWPRTGAATPRARPVSRRRRSAWPSVRTTTAHSRRPTTCSASFAETRRTSSGASRSPSASATPKPASRR